MVLQGSKNEPIRGLGTRSGNEASGGMGMRLRTKGSGNEVKDILATVMLHLVCATHQ